MLPVGFFLASVCPRVGGGLARLEVSGRGLAGAISRRANKAYLEVIEGVAVPGSERAGASWDHFQAGQQGIPVGDRGGCRAWK